MNHSIYSQAIFDNGHTPMLILDPEDDGRIVDANDKAVRYYGWPREVLLSMHILDINTLPPEEVRAEIARARAEDRHFFNFRHRHADGSVTDVEVFSGPLVVAGKTLLYSIIHDVTEKKALERRNELFLKRASRLLELPRLAESLGETEFMQRGLEFAEELTGSTVSFLHFVNENEQSIELITWSRRTLETYCNAAFDRHYPVREAGIWADALRERRAIICNDYASAAGKRGLPKGHAELVRFISLPVVERDKVVMIAGVGNKASDYDDTDVQTLALIAGELWRLAQRERNRREIERFNRAIDRAAVEIYSFDAQSLCFVDANRGACANTGYTLEELRQMTPLDLKPEITREEFERLLSSLREGRLRSVTLATLHRRKDGSTYPVELQIELLAEANPLFVAIGRDLTEHLQRETELQRALAVVEASPVVSFRWRAEPGWPVEYVSNNVSRWGYTADQLKAGAPAYIDLIHPDDLPRIAAEVEHNTAQGIDSYTQEYRLRNAAGEYFWVEDHTRIVRDATGAARYYEGVVADIDFKKRAEMHLMEVLAAQRELNKKLGEAQNQLLQSEKMASIGQLAAGVAHELNNPIGFVSSNLGSLENYLRDLFEIVDAYAVAEVAAPPDCMELARVRELKRQKDFDFLRNDIFQLMAESKEGLARVAKIVKDLKDFSRAGEAVWQSADLHQGLDSTLNIVWNELKYKCTVKKEYGDLPPIWCVPAQLNQVFMNILVNAAHAIPDKGEITIRTGRRGDEVFVAISDTGTGIAPEHLNRIFEPFFTTKPVGKGTGLGLSLSWSIVQKHHGRIEVQSKLGKGSTFTVWLPIEQPQPPAEAVLPAPTSTS
ncbi:MAG: PAS domain S-box protein [Rhodocyclaceae bacterium]|nr:PAS domain S-box protein [Rhodocyclaceae bacterium]